MDSKLIRTRAALPKPLLLKDYLLDDLSSCSSNGFKSFPRRQCCTSVRFIHEFDLKNKHHQKKLLNPNKTSSRSPLSTLRSVITAVKRLPFAAAKSPENKYFQAASSFLPRSFSKKLLKKNGFWKRKPDRKEIGGWKSFDQMVKEDAEPSDGSCSSDSKSNNSWSGSDFTVSDECSSGNSSKEENLNLPERTNDVVEMVMELVSDTGVGVTNGDVSKDSTTNSDDGSASTNSSTNTKEKQWSSDEKEQLSPVSVLDCPFDDDDQDHHEVSSSSFQSRLARMEGAKKKLMMKIQRFECLAKLEPMNLATRFPLQSDSDDSESSGSPLPHSSPSADDTFISDIEEEYEEESEAEDKALELFHQVKTTCNLKLLNSEKLVLDFLRERIGIIGNECDEEEVVEQVEKWINKQEPRGIFLEWEVERNRQAYYDDMEKGGNWKTLDHQEKQELGLDLETQVFAALLDEVLLDISRFN